MKLPFEMLLRSPRTINQAYHRAFKEDWEGRGLIYSIMDKKNWS